MIYQIELDENSSTGKEVINYLKKLSISLHPVKSLLPEQIELLEQSLLEAEEGKTISNKNALK